MTAPSKDQKIIFIRSGNRCAIPTCRRVLIIDRTQNDKESVIGEVAHINGENSGSARYEKDMTPIQRNSCDNLLLVCPACHKEIDDQPNKYTKEILKDIKNKHETWVINSTKQEIVNVTFKELREITNHLLSEEVILDGSYTLISPKDKINKNKLSSQTESFITMGMTQVKRVRDFINSNTDIEFGEKLKQGFVLEYERLKNVEKLDGDDLFSRLMGFASEESNDFKKKAAGLAVVTYLFEKCEVFEK